MFTELRNEVLSRLSDVDRFCRQSCQPDGDRLAAVGKGLAFVNMYAAYEYCVRTSVQAAVVKLNSHSLLHRDVRWELLGLTLHPQLESIADSKNVKKWQSRFDLFERAFSNEVVKANESILPGATEHFFYKHLQLIWQLFRLPEPIVPRPRLVGFVDELVDHRNAVAHGRKTAYEVGRALTSAEIFERVQFTQEICLHVILTIESHFSDSTKMKRM